MFRLKKSCALVSVALALSAGGVWAQPQFQFDFNDLSLAILRDQLDDSPNAFGGWIGKSSVPQVVPGELVAPAGLNYGLNPGGADGYLRVTRTDIANWS